ncbi:MAG TPA: hypothetical protein VNH65_06990 [Candidatus Acidoferrum sp.]|nr:hypothetical protein [Candidatus Acidoferrum sp.]
MRTVDHFSLPEPYKEDRVLAQAPIEHHMSAGIFVPNQITSFHEEIISAVPAGYLHGKQSGSA